MEDRDVLVIPAAANRDADARECPDCGEELGTATDSCPACTDA